MSEYNVKDKVAIVGVGETKYYKRGQAPVPEFLLACEAISKAAQDAGISVKEIDGFSSYSNDRSEATRIAAALDLPEVRLSVMVWGGGGGGQCCSRHRGRLRQLRGRLPRPGAGTIRTLRPGRADQYDRRRRTGLLQSVGLLGA